KLDPAAIRAASAAAAAQPEDVELEQPGDDDGPVHVRLQLSRDLQKRLDKYLVDRIPFTSRTRLQRLIENEAVSVNGRTPKPSPRLPLGGAVDVTGPPPPSKELQPENIPLAVLHDDAALLVVNKSPDVIVHPARSRLSGTMVNALAWHFRNRSSGELSTVG